MDIDFSRKERIVGTFVICVAVLLFATVIIIGRGKDWFETYVTYYTTFEESYNLQVNAAVKLFNADIGKVRKITLVEDKVRVHLDILQRYKSRIRTDTIAKVESPTFIGSEYISITPGEPDSPPISEGGDIQSAERKSVSDIMTEFEVEKTAKMVITAVQDLSEIAKILRDPKGPLFSNLETLHITLSHIENLVGDIKAGKGTLGGVIASEKLLDSIQTSVDRTGIILKNVSRSSEKLPETMSLIQENLISLKSVTTGIDKGILDIRDIIKEIDGNIDTLKRILANVEKGSTDVPEITQTFKAGIKDIRDGVENIDKVVKSLQKNILIKPNLPPEPVVESTDAGLRK